MAPTPDSNCKFGGAGALSMAIAMAACSPPPKAEPATPPQPRGLLASPASYPPARTVGASDALDGVVASDPYRWLEDRDSAEVTTWFRAEDRLARATLQGLPERAAIAARLRLLQGSETREEVVHAGQATFFLLSDGKSDRGRLVRQADSGEASRVVLDPNGWGDDNLGDWSPSMDGSRIAFQTKHHNADAATLRVLDVATGTVSSTDVLDGIEDAVPQWTPAGDGFYYVHTPRDVPHPERFGFQSVRRHRLGSPQSADETVFEHTGDPTQTLECVLDAAGQWLVVTVHHGWSGADVYFRRPESAAPWRRLDTLPTASYRVLPLDGALLVQTDENAPNGRVLRVDPERPARERWIEVVPERKNVALKRASVFGDRLLLTYTADALSTFVIHDLRTNVRTVDSPGIGASYFTGRQGDDTAFMHFSSMGSPPSIWRVSMHTGRRSLFFRRNVRFDADRFVTERVFASSKDGTRVPVFVVHARDAPQDGSAPALLYGYGGFRVSLQPAFDERVIPWLEDGGVYAIACTRGGLENGETWHRAGMLHEKQNVFDDFIAAAEALVTRRFTSRERLVIEGASNGGLLVAAVATQRPDLFRAVLCGEPLADMIRFPLFGRGGVPELGDPTKPDDFRALIAYSPYHRIRDGARYPAFLVTASADDERADAMHARKLVARLQAASVGGPVLLRVEWAGGHLGAAGAGAAIEKRSDELAFARAVVSSP
jgi:prolyl oligopeptidase